jgi:RNA polymerase sigma-70 factor (ECF subfamily)
MSDRNQHDLVLIRRAQDGDRSAFNELISTHEAKVFQYAFRLTRNLDDASDIAVEAFVRAFTAIRHFKGQSAFSTWIYRIVTNCFLDHKKKHRNKQTISLDSPSVSPESDLRIQIEDEAPTPFERSTTSERERKMQDAVAKLPEYQRAMIVMYHAELLSYEEISAALDLPIGTVKSRLNRARVSLRDLLADDLELFEE